MRRNLRSLAPTEASGCDIGAQTRGTGAVDHACIAQDKIVARHRFLTIGKVVKACGSSFQAAERFCFRWVALVNEELDLTEINHA